MNTGNEKLLEKILDLKLDLKKNINTTLKRYDRWLQQAYADHDVLMNEIQRHVAIITKSDEDSKELEKLIVELDMIDKDITDLIKATSALNDSLKILNDLDALASTEQLYTIIKDIKRKLTTQSDLLDLKRFVIRQLEFNKLKHTSAIKNKDKLEKQLINAAKGTTLYKKIQDNLNEANEEVETATFELETAERDITTYEMALKQYNDLGFIVDSSILMDLWENIREHELFAKMRDEEMAVEPPEELRFNPETNEQWPLSKFIAELGHDKGVSLWEMLGDEGIGDEGSSFSFEQLPGTSQMHAAAQPSISASQPLHKLKNRMPGTSQSSTSGSQPRRGFTKKYKPTSSLQQTQDEKQAPPPQTDVRQLLSSAELRRQAVKQTLSKRKGQGGRKQRHIAKTKKTMRLEYLLNLSNKLLKHKFKKQRNIKNIRKTKKYKNNKK